LGIVAIGIVIGSGSGLGHAFGSAGGRNAPINEE
jgi:hypothetical protein